MNIDFLINKIAENQDKTAFILNDKKYSYKELLEKTDFADEYVKKSNISEGDVVAIDADFSPMSTAVLFALIKKNCIIVPLSKQIKGQKQSFLEIAMVNSIFYVENEELSFERINETKAEHELYSELRKRNHPGLVLFSSGSTGVSKAAVHDFGGILENYKKPGKTKRMITFLLFDHIGGINTLLRNIANGGVVITIKDRNVNTVLGAVEKYKVEVLPVTPTFINIILLSEAYKNYDLSSLDTISYGTEVMPESTLKRLHALYPDIRLLQTYGLSEVGIMRSKSKSSDSLWVKVGGEGFETRIVDNMLEIKAKSAMLGYLNAKSPFTEDGWFQTFDVVEQDGEYIKILGRKSEIINVGGEKVYPAEVESVLMQMENVKDVAVMGEKHPILGNIVTAKIELTQAEDSADLKKRVRAFCKGKIPPFKIPQKISITENDLHSERFKKMRK